MKVYIAAPYSRKEEMNVYAAKLRELGIEVTSRWLNEPHKSSIQMPDLTHEQHLEYAMQDVNDIMDSDAMVFFTDPTKTILRAGRHVEFGMVLALNHMLTEDPLPIFVVGLEFENIFHHMPNVSHFQEWDLALDAVCRFAIKFDHDMAAGL